MSKKNSIVGPDQISGRILMIRGQRVMIDSDLADLYGVPTKALNQAVKRNWERFPEDFMFQLTKTEKIKVVTDCDHLAKLKFSHTLPYAFTEHGAVMLASVLSTERAVEVSVYVVRAFIKLREMLAAQRQVASKLDELENRVDTHDEAITNIIRALRQLMKPAVSNQRRIGFKSGGEDNGEKGGLEPKNRRKPIRS